MDTPWRDPIDGPPPELTIIEIRRRGSDTPILAWWDETSQSFHIQDTTGLMIISRFDVDAWRERKNPEDATQ